MGSNHLKTMLFALQLTVAGGFMVLGFGTRSVLCIFGIVLIFIGLAIGGWQTRPH